MSRGGTRAIIVLAGVVVVLAGLWFALFRHKPPELDPKLWDQYRSRFITADGRVIDRDKDPAGITHSEGQGYAMLLAEAEGDREHFDLIWRWTRSHLRRPDGLFSWKYTVCGARGYCVADKNNASDGDVLIAWALLRAGKDWGREDYATAAREIAGSVSKKLIISYGGHTLLLPAVDGFSDQSGFVVNLSYWIVPAFNAFAAELHEPIWSRLSQSAPALLQEARFGKWQLPPDWLHVGKDQLRLAKDFPSRYSFDAVRIPLYLVWGGVTDRDTLTPFLTFWSETWPQGVPAWVDLETDAVAPYAWSAGVASIAQLTERAVGTNDTKTAELPLPGPKDGYYSWSLSLLSRVAAAEMKR